MSWKGLGDGISEGERALEGVLAGIAAWRGRPMRYRPVAGGISNTNWRVAIGDTQDYFVKMPGRGTEMFITRDCANDASRRAEACGYGVQVVDYLPMPESRSSPSSRVTAPPRISTS